MRIASAKFHSEVSFVDEEEEYVSSFSVQNQCELRQQLLCSARVYSASSFFCFVLIPDINLTYGTAGANYRITSSSSACVYIGLSNNDAILDLCNNDCVSVNH